MEMILGWLIEYEYVAMFAILTLCGVGLPLPEEATLLSSGLLVGWHEADFLFSTLACSAGILLGDSIIFGLGHHFGQRFLNTRPMRLVLPPKQQEKVQKFFANHGSKALFLARFFPGVRIGVYAYAGSQRLSWARFIQLDFLGVIISCPLSIAIGRWAGRAFADDRAEAMHTATELGRRFGHWIIIILIVAVVAVVIVQKYLRRPSPRP